jgi:probable biosynthetic protein (TIGR04098 family)
MTPAGAAAHRCHIGMPQMAMGWLSENWLLKELGNLHWQALCRSLGTQSQDLKDARGRRLYATFVRVRLDLPGTLAAFREGDDLLIEGEVSRFGRSTVIGRYAIASDGASGSATMMSTFSVREVENTALAKSEPLPDYDGSIAVLSEPPAFFTEYSDVRRRLGRARYPDAGAERYFINPFADSNGANLLYFSSYQTIHDFFHRSSQKATRAREIFYFRNSGLSDSIYLVAAEGYDLLCRASDSEPIAAILVQKE